MTGLDLFPIPLVSIAVACVSSWIAGYALGRVHGWRDAKEACRRVYWMAGAVSAHAALCKEKDQ